MFDDRQRPDLTAVGNVDGQWTRRAAYPPAPQGSIVARTDDQWRAGVLDGLLVAAGMPPAVALAAATMTARDALGMPARPGDVVTFDDDPSVDATALCRPVAVLAAGRRVL